MRPKDEFMSAALSILALIFILIFASIGAGLRVIDWGKSQL